MLVCNLKGGLGNQLFQLYTTIAASMHLHIPFKFFNDSRIGNRGTYWTTLFRRLNPVFLISRTQFMQTHSATLQVVHEPHFNYLPFERLFAHVDTSPDSNRSFLLDGYFQSPNYFKPVRETISRMLQIEQSRDAVRPKWRAILEQNGVPAADTSETAADTVSMHFRLGDYKGLPNHYPIVPLSYYRDALLHLEQKTGKLVGRVILYFCEDDDFAQVTRDYITPLSSEFAHLKWVRCKSTSLHPEHAMDDWEEMLAMSLCNHHIIANSSFSWWGAYFNPHYARVYYPSRWFGPSLKHHHTHDLFPAEWTRIDCGENGTPASAPRRKKRFIITCS